MLPQIIFIVLLCAGVGHKVKEKGQAITENGFITVIATLLTQGLYYWGGFWNQGEWPQFTMGILLIFVTLMASLEHGKSKVSKGLTIANILGTIFVIVLLWFGHFFDPIIRFFQ